MTKVGTYPRRGLHGAVVHDIGVRIVRGDLEPGDSIPFEEALGVEVGGDAPISRTVIREAVKVLAAKRLVDSRPKHGTRVLPRREWNLLDPDVLAWQREAGADRRFLDDMLELRALIEPHAARLAAQRATEAQVHAMEEAVEAMKAAGENAVAFLDPDLRFHTLLLEATHNELLEHMATIVTAVLRTIFTYSGRPPGAYAHAAELHRAVVAAIGQQDPDRAEEALVALGTDTTQNIGWALDSGRRSEGGGGGPPGSS